MKFAFLYIFILLKASLVAKYCNVALLLGEYFCR